MLLVITMRICAFVMLLLGILDNPSDHWVGKWYKNSLLNNAELVITPLEGNSFHFVITAFSGAHTGEIEGDAIINENTAQCVMNIDNEERHVHFVRTPKGITVTTKNCEGYFGGSGVVFDGDFVSTIIPEQELADEWIASIIPDRVLVKKIKNALGKSYVPFVYRLHLRFPEQCLDNFKATVISGCVTGVCHDMAAIIMYTENKQFYLAWIEEGKIYYMSSDSKFKRKLPKTISQWAKNFEATKIVFK